MARKRTSERNTMSETQVLDAPTDNTDAVQEFDGTDTNTDTDTDEGNGPVRHVFNVGDQATVVRGKLRGRRGVILRRNAVDETYAMELDGGTLAIVNAKNLKPPVDSTISMRALVSVLAEFAAHEPDTAVRLASALDAIAPEVSVKLNEALAA
jgi:hypothetical protein